MSKIARDLDVVHSRLIETLNRKHEREVKRMNEVHSQNTGEIRKGQSMDLVNLQENHERQIASENEKKERVLSQLKGNLDESKRVTDKELEELKEFRKKEVADIQGKLANDRERIGAEHNANLTDMNERFIEANRRVNNEGNERLAILRDQMNEQYSERASFNQKKLDQQHSEHTTRYTKDGENYFKMTNEQKRNFEKERLNTHKKQDSTIIQMTDIHKKEVEKRDFLKREDLKQQELFFEKKYADSYKRHNEHYKILDETNDKAVKQLKAELSKEVEFKQSRQDDPFFQFVELKPTLELTETGVRIRVKVPDHSKQDLQLNLNGKEAVVNFNRRYIDNQKDDQGNSSRVSKIETLSTRLQTGVHLDPKSVKGSYQDGVMTYEIKKA